MSATALAAAEALALPMEALEPSPRPLRILLMMAHSIEEYDQVRLLSGLGYDVFSIGAYIDPRSPLDDMRPPLPDAPLHLDLKAAVDDIPAREGEDRLDMAKSRLPREILDWCDVIVCHHLEHRWLWPQWRMIRDKRVIWRTVGQSGHANEWQAQPFVKDGCEVVRYSPRERSIPNYAGESCLIRFYKDEDEWTGWGGEDPLVVNVQQNPVERKEWVNLAWQAAALKGLPYRFVGKLTEPVGGVGKVSLEVLRSWLRRSRAYLYTGTQPASYTLGLIEAMMTGTPVVSIGPEWHRILPYGPSLYEGHLLAPLWASSPEEARSLLSRLLESWETARAVSEVSRGRAVALFGRGRAEKAWRGWLDGRIVPDPDPEELPDVSEVTA